MRPRVTAFPPTRATTLRLTNVVVLWYWAQHDIQPQDVFVVADLDELLSREFLAALKHCEVHPGMEQPGGQCSKVVALTFGHKVSVLLGAELASGVTVQTLPASTTAPVSQTEVVVGAWTRQYTFDCTSQRPAGHYHPDITLGKCVFFFGPEELRMNYGTDWTQPHKLKYARQYRPQVGPPPPRHCALCRVPRCSARLGPLGTRRTFAARRT